MTQRRSVPVIVACEFADPPYAAVVREGERLSDVFYTQATGVQEINFLYNQYLIDEDERENLFKLLAVKDLPGPRIVDSAPLN